MVVSAEDFLNRLRQDADQLGRDIRQQLEGLSEAQQTQRPADGRWSVAHCLEHLTTTGILYHPRIAKTIERATTDPGLYKPRWLARTFIRFASPEGRRRKLSAPKRFKPADDLPPNVNDRFFEQHTHLIELMDAARGRNLNRPRFGSPLTSLLRFSIGEGLELMVRHQQRHLLQIQEVVEAI
jgi:hypothetical protein